MHTWSDKAQGYCCEALPSLNGGSLKITRTVPLNILIRLKFQGKDCTISPPINLKYKTNPTVIRTCQAEDEILWRNLGTTWTIWLFKGTVNVISSIPPYIKCHVWLTTVTLIALYMIKKKWVINVFNIKFFFAFVSISWHSF